MIDGRILLLGGGGFIGVNLAEFILARGGNVRVFGRRMDPILLDKFSRRYGGNFEFFSGDFNSVHDVRVAAQGCSAAVHLVTATLPASSNADMSFDVEANLISTLKFLDVARAHDIKRIVFLSSGGTVYGKPLYTPINEEHPTDPLSSYGITKLAIEKYMGLYNYLHNFSCVILRVSNPYGPWQNVQRQQGAINVFIDRVRKGLDIQIWGDGTVIRDYIFVYDVVRAIYLALGYKGNKTVLNIGSGVGTDLNTIIDIIEKVSRKKLKISYSPGRTFDVPANVLDVTLARKELGWNSKISLVEGIERMNLIDRFSES